MSPASIPDGMLAGDTKNFDERFSVQEAPTRFRRLAAIMGAVILTGSTLIACANEDSDNAEGQADTNAAAGDDANGEAANGGNGVYREARAANRNRNVAPEFGQGPQVVSDAGNTGLETSRLFFEDSETLVVSGPSDAAQLRAASIAVVSHAPVVRHTPEQQEEILAEIDRLGASRVLTVGEVDLPDLGDDIEVFADGGTTEDLADLTAKEFTEQPVSDYAEMAEATANLDPEQSILLVPEWEEFPATRDAGDEELPALPAQSRRDADAAPVIIASPATNTVDVANARSYGGEVRVMEYPDPRLNTETMEMVAGLSDQPLVALGEQFGDAELLAEKIRLGETVTTELPGGGGLVFPGRRMIAFYGHHSGPALGVMGEQGPEEAVARVEEHVANYQDLVDEPVIPAFEVITTVASEFPGEDGNYTNTFPIEEIRPYVDAIIDAGGYAVLDLQPGRASFLEQAKLYEELLLHPNVGLALDPEWNLQPHEQPMQRVGHAEAWEVNEVSEWLAELVRENELPQKALVLHQFQLQMLRDRDQINTDHPELAFVLHADGHGAPEQKFDTWNVMQQDLDQDAYFMAWKNFIDEDTPMFTPEQTYDVEPRPWFVSYQ